MTEQADALVVGAGISGLTAAIAFTRSGRRVQVQDRAPAVDARGAALGLWPPAWRGLEAIGVTRHLDDVWDYRSATIRSSRGELLGHLPLARIERQYGAPVRLVGRPALMAGLAAVAEDLGVDVRLGTPFDPGAAHGAGVVVGADGINSQVREAVSPARPRSLGATAWRGSCEGHVGGWGEIWGRGMFAGVTPAGRDRTNWYVAVADGVGVHTPEDLREVLAGWPGEIRSAVGSTKPDDLLRHPLHDLPALPTYTRGPVALLGDAAHAMAPSLGQGACQAILDALSLARCLARARDVASALADYDRSQRPAGNRLVRRSRLLLRLQLAPGSAPARDLALRALRPVSPR